MRAYIFLAVLVVLIPIGLFSPFGGLLSYTWVSYFNPHEYTFGFVRRLPVALLIVIPTLVGLIFTTKRKAPPRTAQTVLLAFLWVWFAITTLNVHESGLFVSHWTDTLQKFEQVSKLLFMAFISLMLVIDSRRLRLWYLVTAGSFALLAFKCAVWGLFTGGQFKVYGPPQSMLADNNDFGLAMNIALPMFLCLARTEESKWLQRVFWVALPMGIIAVVLTFSRGAMLGLMALLFVWAIRSRHKLLGAVGLCVAIVVLLVVAPEAWIQRMKTLQTAPSTDASAQSRLRSWTFATKLAMDHPIFGGGFETFTPELYESYAVSDTHGPHSIYFQMLAEHGVPGLTIFLALVASCWVSCGRISRRWQYEDPPYLAEYARMTQLSFTTFLVSGAFLGRAYFDLFYQLIVTTIILKSLEKTEMAKVEGVEVDNQDELVPESAALREV